GLTSGKSKLAVDIQGLDKAPISHVEIRDSDFENVADGSVVKNLDGIKLDNVKINGKQVTALS
ncbi:MAG: glycoside hydrolase family 28 protein, partial [Pyrinomonadaceae bacterium]